MFLARLCDGRSTTHQKSEDRTRADPIANRNVPLLPKLVGSNSFVPMLMPMIKAGICIKYKEYEILPSS